MSINAHSTLLQRLYQLPVVAIRWDPFTRTAEIDFWDDETGTTTIRLGGIHFLGSRQSLFMPADEPPGLDCTALFVDISDDSDFLDKFLSKALGFASDIGICDTRRRRPNDQEFSRPVHFSLVTASAILDVICESINTEPAPGGDVV
jgi:hypothetical protein